LADNGTYYYGTGRRKNAVARVRLYPGEGTIMVNNKPPLQYFGRRMPAKLRNTPSANERAAPKPRAHSLIGGAVRLSVAAVSGPIAHLSRAAASSLLRGLSGASECRRRS
jgi:hypothetical protein